MGVSVADYQDLYQKILRGCEGCPWADRKSRTVPPEGPVPCRIMVVGRNPGATEDDTGRPFVGPAGQALDQFLSDCGLERSSVYITNTAKCHGGPGDPCPDDRIYDACESFLEQEITLVKPGVIITLGADAYRRMACDLTSITRVQGSVQALRWGSPVGGADIIPVTHPSFWIRNRGYYGRVVKPVVVPVLKRILATGECAGLDSRKEFR